MLDPLTIATSCISLINGITSLTLHIAVFVNDVRGARKDMDMISRELTSLSLCLGALRTDCQSHRVEYPEASRKGIEQALLNIDLLTQQVKEVLQNLYSGKLGRRIQWTIQSKDNVDRLRSSLETQKSTIEIALQCGSIQILCAIQRQVEKPAQDLTRLTDTTQAIREDAEVLRRDAVDIKQLIRQEADALRAEITALRNSKTLSTDIQDFLRLSQDYSSHVTGPFITREQSDAGLDDSLTEAFSQSSLILTPDFSVNPVKSTPLLEQGQNFSLMCPSCGHRLIRENLPTEMQPPKSSSNTSAVRNFSRRIRSEAFDHVAASSDDSAIPTTIRCGQYTFNTTFSKDAEFAAIPGWFYPTLRLEEEKSRFWVPEINKVADIRLSLNGFEVVSYPGETLSNLARIYGFGSVLELDATGKPQNIPDFRKHINLSPSQILVSGSGDTFTITFNLNNGNDVRWHAPVAWCWKYTGPEKKIMKPEGGVIQPGAYANVSLSTRDSSSGFKIGDKLLLQAVLLKPGYNPEHWKRLILMTPQTDRWEYVMTCTAVGRYLHFTADPQTKTRRRIDQGQLF